MSTDIDHIDWGAVTDDGFARAEIQVCPFAHVDIHEINMSFYYTGEDMGLLRLFRNLATGGRGTWILYTDMSGELSYENAAKWVVRRIKKTGQVTNQAE